MEDAFMTAVVSIVGKSSTGKTTFLEKLLRELSGRGYKVATIKHSHHSLDFHDPKKDSYRHAQAGAVATMVSSTTSVQIIKPVPQELKIEELARNYGEDYDLILTEGFSRGDAPKIEIHRKEAGPILDVASNLIAMVTDEPLETSAPQFALEDVKGVADLIEANYLKANRERLSFFINGKKAELKNLPSDVLQQIVAALNKDLKVSDINSLEFYYKK
jgi:molybdopterin-guanine dinucleotide biosynthesis adapter protein